MVTKVKSSLQGKQGKECYAELPGLRVFSRVSRYKSGMQDYLGKGCCAELPGFSVLCRITGEEQYARLPG
jgi:hypothetical protein